VNKVLKVKEISSPQRLIQSYSSSNDARLVEAMKEVRMFCFTRVTSFKVQHDLLMCELAPRTFEKIMTEYYESISDENDKIGYLDKMATLLQKNTFLELLSDESFIVLLRIFGTCSAKVLKYKHLKK